ncbi:MAG: hypothetical protein J6125_02210, partial [Clostridia bacterium]|nr:hypothetical protein [Clostridia bacterium]
MEKSEKKAKTPRMIALIVLVCLLAAALLGTGAALIARRVTRGPVVYRYEDLRVREGVVRCLFAYYRAAIPVAYDEISDTPAYWSATVDGVSNGERWGEAALRGVRETIAAARLFDECGTLSESERERLRADLDEVYARAGGRDAYDELAAPLGFDHRDLESATLLLRKAALLADARWGEAGESVDAGALTTYLRDNYVCVRLIRVRVTDKMKKVEEGLYVLDGSLYVTESRTDEEQA